MTHSSKTLKIVFTLAERLLKLGCTVGLDNYYSSPELCDILNDIDIDAVGTVRPNRK
jgi:hypothetical protein